MGIELRLEILCDRCDDKLVLKSHGRRFEHKDVLATIKSCAWKKSGQRILCRKCKYMCEPKYRDMPSRILNNEFALPVGRMLKDEKARRNPHGKRRNKRPKDFSRATRLTVPDSLAALIAESSD